VTPPGITFTPDQAGLIHLAEQVATILEERGLTGPRRRFVSKEGLAKHLDISDRQVRQLREKGLPGRRIGKKVFFDINEVAAWIDREGV
jgi:hypothetical protein